MSKPLRLQNIGIISTEIQTIFSKSQGMCANLALSRQARQIQTEQIGHNLQDSLFQIGKVRPNLFFLLFNVKNCIQNTTMFFFLANYQKFLPKLSLKKLTK